MLNTNYVPRTLLVWTSLIFVISFVEGFIILSEALIVVIVVIIIIITIFVDGKTILRE